MKWKRILKRTYINTYIFVSLNHFVVHLKLIQHCKSTILQKERKKGGERERKREREKERKKEKEKRKEKKKKKK